MFDPRVQRPAVVVFELRLQCVQAFEFCCARIGAQRRAEIVILD
jgi:hypothetical protein